MIRERGNVVTQVWVIPNHVDKTEWVQPLPELTTWSECPYGKKGVPKEGEKLLGRPKEKRGKKRKISTLFQIRKLSSERVFYFPKNTQEVSRGAGIQIQF